MQQTAEVSVTNSAPSRRKDAQEQEKERKKHEGGERMKAEERRTRGRVNGSACVKR